MRLQARASRFAAAGGAPPLPLHAPRAPLPRPRATHWAVIISNHPDLRHVASTFGVDFVHLPIRGGEGGSKEAAKAAQEAAVQGAIDDAGADLVVLARYMQVGRRSCFRGGCGRPPASRGAVVGRRQHGGPSRVAAALVC